MRSIFGNVIDTPFNLLSLGAGVQSSTLALMAECGEVGPIPNAAIFADTQAEPKSVYVWLKWLTEQLSYPVNIVTAGSLTEKSLLTKTNAKTGKKYYSNLIPAFIENPDGSKGIVGRHCTYNHKLIPIMKAARQMVGADMLRAWRKKHAAGWAEFQAAKKAKRRCDLDAWREMQADAIVTQWIGISLDEVSRAKPSHNPWIVHRWPLIELGMKRHDCLRWMETRGYPTPPRSACTYCPFHSDAEWRRLKFDEPEEFAVAVKFERDLQALHAGHPMNGRIKGIPYLHDSLVPLGEIDFSTDEEKGQSVMRWGNECEGMCGV